MKEENGDLIEYEHEYSAVLEADKKCKKHGWRYFQSYQKEIMNLMIK